MQQPPAARPGTQRVARSSRWSGLGGRLATAPPGLAGLSGYLPLADTTAAERLSANRETPVFLAHGQQDGVVPMARGAAARDLLQAQGQPLQLLSGPERIEAGWWDGQGVARDYFIALASDGSLVWVWRARLAAPPGEVNWYLQGRFA